MTLMTLMTTGVGVDVAEAKENKAVLVLLDGIPADVLESVPTPHIDAISKAGGYSRAYVGGEAGGLSESPTISAVGYQTMLTGTWANKHNVWGNDIKEPNYDYWDIFRMVKTQNINLQTAIYSTWEDNRTKLLGDGLVEAGGKKVDYSFDGLEHETEQYPHDPASDYIRDIDAAVTTDAAQHLRTVGPTLSWLYLQYTDDIGHRFGDGGHMQKAVQKMDERVGEVWNAVQERSRESGENWLVVVTTDHGRDMETGKHHGGQSERERTIWIATNSQRLDESFFKNPAMVDILPSVIDHLNVSVPASVREQLDGQSFLSSP